MIVVNATALRFGGALTILHQFIDSIELDSSSYLFFVHPSVRLTTENENIKIVKTNKTKLLSRIYWDWVGLQKYLTQKGIKPEVVISLQNTSIKIKQSCPQVIYLHQSIPFTEYKWSILKKRDWFFLFYKYFYSYFIFRYVTQDTNFIVQTQWVKDVLIDRGIRDTQVLVAKPEVKLPSLDKIDKLNLEGSKYSIFYPAAPHGYKNHKEIVYALSRMKELGRDCSDIAVYLTFDSSESPQLYALIKQQNMEKNFIFLGGLTFSDVVKYYKSVDLVVFPSCLETFGLPLIEAATLGKPIVAIDLPYARDALSQYNGVEFCKANDSLAWAKSILNQLNKSSFEPVKPSGNGWESVHNFIESIRS